MSSSTSKEQQTLEVMPRQTMRGHTDSIICVVHLHRVRRIITGSRDGSLRLWDLGSGAQIGEDWRDEGKQVPVWGIALSPNGKTVASGSDDGAVRLWNVETGKIIAKWTGDTSGVWSVCWSADGERVVSGSMNGVARVWDVESRQSVLKIKLKTGHKECVQALVYSPDNTKIVTAGDKSVQIWAANTGDSELLATLKHDFTTFSLAWTSDGEKLITASEFSIKIFNTTTWEQIAILEGHTDFVLGISLSENDRLLASASWDMTARLWNLETNLPVGPPLQHINFVRFAVFSGKQLVTGCGKNAYVWDIHSDTGKVMS